MHAAKQMLILTAPPASGKTFWIESFVAALGPAQQLLVISPLRALANECNDKWGDKIKTVTPEEWLAKGGEAEVVIFDEFHLYFYWGDSFRERMWEAFYGLAHAAQLAILLTATLSSEMLAEIKHFEAEFDQLHWCDLGNRQLLRPPAIYLQCPSSTWLRQLLLQNVVRDAGCALVFCAYRAEVRRMGEALERAGYRVWTCVGGEAQQFREKLQQESPPDFIVATTVLSHGVNLPRIYSIYFLYPVKNIDFWIQMVARGGRRGERYKVFALERPYGMKWNRFSNFFRVQLLDLKLRWQSMPRRIGQWFSKDWSFTAPPTKNGI
jgi:ATP-dependent DNA helicase RecQ